METQWLDSLEEGLRRGEESKRPVLLDINAAPR